jgi:hypothetical protein
LKPLGAIRLDRRDRRSVLMALQLGRQLGLRCASDVIDQLTAQLHEARAQVERIEAELQRERTISRIRRRLADAVLRKDAQRERANGNVTLH